MRDAYDILAALVAADEAAGEPAMFDIWYSAQGPVIIGRTGWRHDMRAPADVEIDELVERSWVRVSQAEDKGRHFAVTAAGRNAAAKRSAQLSAAKAPVVTLDWSVVSGVLKQVYEAYRAIGAPEHGVETAALINDADEPGSVRAALRELARAGYLEDLAEDDWQPAPRLVRPTPLALERVAGWPGSSAQAALDELVAALDHEIARTPDEEKRSKLSRVRDGLLGAARDVAIAYFEKKVAGL